MFDQLTLIIYNRSANKHTANIPLRPSKMLKAARALLVASGKLISAKFLF